MSSVATTPYDTAGDVLTSAIVFSNDWASANGIAGNILNAAQPGVIPLMKERYRWLQQRLISANVETQTKYWVVYSLPPAATQNLRISMELTYNGFFDQEIMWGPNPSAPVWSSAITYQPSQVVNFNGTTYIAKVTPPTNLNMQPDLSPLFWALWYGPVLPPDLRKPLELWECPSGGYGWKPMVQAPDSVSTRPLRPIYEIWDWKNDKLLLPPCSSTMDLKIQGVCMAPDITSLDTPVMVMNCSTALAYLIVAEASRSRGGQMSTVFDQKAEAAIKQIINQSVRKDSYTIYVRRPFRGLRQGRRRGL